MENELFLQHHGVLGQKWGVRRYQNKDGSLTEKGKNKARRELNKKFYLTKIEHIGTIKLMMI